MFILCLDVSTSFIQSASQVSVMQDTRSSLFYSYLLNSNWIALFSSGVLNISTSMLWEGNQNINHFKIKLLNTLESHTRKLDFKKVIYTSLNNKQTHWEKLQQRKKKKKKKLCRDIKMPSYNVKTRFKNQTKMTVSLCPALLWLLICISIEQLKSSSPVCNGKQKWYPVLSQHSAIAVCCVRT